MLESGKTQNDLDTGWTLAPKNSKKTDSKKDAANAASSVNPSQKTLPKALGQWSQWDSNPRPLACHASALPTELWPQTQNNINADNQYWQANSSVLSVWVWSDFLAGDFLFVNTHSQGVITTQKALPSNCRAN